jgi:hypothetical protein
MIPKFVRRFLERRRFPTLMLLGAALFIANLLMPDPIPFVDEILMLIATVAIGSVRSRKKPDDAPPES